MENHTQLYNILLLTAGLFIRYQVGRRRFNRRSIAGMQIYSGYLRALLTTVIETLLNLAGAICIIIALIRLIVHLF
jgi:hypothetical protein